MSNIATNIILTAKEQLDKLLNGLNGSINLANITKDKVVTDINTAAEKYKDITDFQGRLNSFNTKVTELDRQIGQGVTDDQLDKAVKKKIEDGSIPSLMVGKDSISNINLQRNSVTDVNIGFTGLRKGYFVTGGLYIDNVLGELKVKAGTYLMYENSFILWESETSFSYTKSSGALYLLASKTTKSLSMELVANLPNDNNVFCLGILFRDKIYSYCTENIFVNNITNGGWDSIENRTDVRIAENSHVSGTLTVGKFVIDTVTKTIRTEGSTLVLAWHNRGIVIPSQDVSFNGLTGEIHLAYDKVNKVIICKTVPFVSSTNLVFLGILYKGKIFNTTDKEVWEIDGVKNGGWISPTSDKMYIPEVTLPNIMYCIVNDRLDIYYDNIILYSDYFKKHQYFIKPMIVNADGSYSTPQLDDFDLLDYKMQYTPKTAKSIKLEFRIEDAYTGEIIHSKKVMINSVSNTQVKSFNMIDMGDSFFDGGGTRALYEMFPSYNLNVNFIGLNSGGVKDNENVRDEAYASKGYIWYTQKSTYTDGVALRKDRPLSDALWDSGWGKGEVNGWREGQTYDDLTDVQRSHGRTKNPFWNPTTQKFDFAYYVNTYLNDQRFDNSIYKPINDNTPVDGRTVKHIDCVASFAGLNDVIWMDKFYTTAYQTELLNSVYEIIDSIRAYDPQIKIFISTVTPQRENDESIQQLSYFDKNFKHYKKSKFMQELWNKLLIDKLYVKYSGTINIIPTSANIDTRFAFNVRTIRPNKFDTTYTEKICQDIHPADAITNGYGHKYIADMAKNVLYSNM